MSADILPGRRILVVEDEMMVVMMIEQLLEEAGCTVTAAGRLEQALVHAQAERFDAALLDVNLNGEWSYPVGDVLAARGIPFVFATGYGVDGLPGDYPDVPVMAKPFKDHELLDTLRALLGGSGAFERDPR